MKLNIAITAAALAAILTSLTSALAPSARGLREADKALWSRLSGSICSGCESEKSSTRSAQTDPIAVLAAGPRSTTAAVSKIEQQPKVRVAEPNRGYVSLHRSYARRYAVRMRKKRDHLASLKLRNRVQIAVASERVPDRISQEQATRVEWSAAAADIY